MIKLKNLYNNSFDLISDTMDNPLYRIESYKYNIIARYVYDKYGNRFSVEFLNEFAFIK